ncbi:MAG TPA: flagellar biosynthesis protein FlhA [Armatimonadota bacterium]|nr:flagellar biosynthesis protein FlhA [Armatimonadota bacterium]
MLGVFQSRQLTNILTRMSDMQAPLLLVVVIGMLIIPMPSFVLDFFLVANLGITLLILLTTTNITQPLELSVFPSLLLVTTLFRLALNISATRLILSSGDELGAGRVIHAFGNFVVGSNPVVGFVIFIILVVIQFVVITAGAGRVAEVAARFTLDAMPGKQMAIDADLNAGLIDEKQARKRRQDISREADFYGAMDGASKFVRGDAIAAIIMVIINILGGFAVGVLMHKLSLPDALHQYTMKTVGEGIVTQIPALIMSIATGLIVTRAASESNLGHDLVNQVMGNDRTLMITGAIIGSFAVVPGLPSFPFITGALVLGGLGYYKWKHAAQNKQLDKVEEQPVAKAPTTTEEMIELLAIDPIEVEIGYGLIHLADPAQGGDLLERITSLRRQIALDMGFVVPPVRVRDNIQLQSNSYSIKLWSVEIAHGDIMPKHYLAMNPGNGHDHAIPGAIATTEPAFGLPALWVPEQQKLEAEMSGYTVVDPTTVLITHLSELIRNHAHEILSRQDAQLLIDKMRSVSPALIDELIPKVISLSEVHRILQSLLRERVSIRDLNRILSSVSDHVSATRDIDQLTEYARQSLARAISEQQRGTDGSIEVFTLEPALEEMLIAHLRPTQFGTQIVLDPVMAQQVLLKIKEQAERAITLGNQPVALCSSQLRPYLRRFIEKYIPGLTILSHAEIASGIPIRTNGTIMLPLQG